MMILWLLLLLWWRWIIVEATEVFIPLAVIHTTTMTLAFILFNKLSQSSSTRVSNWLLHRGVHWRVNIHPASAAVVELATLLLVPVEVSVTRASITEVTARTMWSRTIHWLLGHPTTLIALLL